MISPWVESEMATADLEDKRLNGRLTIVLEQLAAKPTASIPAACGGHAETESAYRFFANKKVSFDTVLQPHCDATRERMRAQAVVILAQDTTEIDVTRPEQQVLGAGPMDGSSRRGAFLHPLHAFTPDGTPLGTVYATAWVRPVEEEGITNASRTRAQRAAMPIEQKESHRWVVGLQQSRDVARHCPETQIVCVADSEADIYELLVEGIKEPESVEWIVRACQNRALSNENGEKAAASYLRERILAEPVRFTKTISVRGRKAKISCDRRGRRQPRESRLAEMEIRAGAVTLRPPWRADRMLPEVTVNVVLVREIRPPKNDEPVEWLLLTSLPIDSAEQVRQVLGYYTVRWMIEVLFRTLKTGCRVEERRFEHIDRLLPCLAVYLIVAWRTLYVCRLGRSIPEVPCEAIFEPAEWKSVYKVIHRQDPPKTAPAMREMVRMVAQLGGYVNKAGRKDEPGPQTIWIGLQRTHDIAMCWKLFQAEDT